MSCAEMDGRARNVSCVAVSERARHVPCVGVCGRARHVGGRETHIVSCVEVGRRIFVIIIFVQHVLC